MANPKESYSDLTTIKKADEFRKRKATSVLAIVFTDIAGSTMLNEQLGEIEYQRLKEEYDNNFTDIIEGNDAGCVVKSTGDGALAVFSEPSTDVERCVEVQSELGNHNHFKLRTGIDMGQVSVKSEKGIVRDVFGGHVNRASRIEALSEPGHVLTSFTIYDCAYNWLKGTNIEWYNHGIASLKGFQDPISLHEAYDPSLYSPQCNNNFPSI